MALDVVGRYEQLELFELTEVIVETAARIAEGEVVNAEDKLDLAEQMYEARRRMPRDREYGAWWRSTGISYSRPWRAVLVRAGERIVGEGRPGVNRVNTGGEFSIRRFAETGDGWITGDDETVAKGDELGGDEWYTPVWLFDALGLTYDLDVCAPEDRTYVSTPAKAFLTEIDDGLRAQWSGLVWCNPPYSDPEPWAERMIEHGSGMLLSHVPINGLWCVRVWQRAQAVRFLQGMVFVRPNGQLQRPGYWLQLAAFGRTAADALAAMTVPDNVDERFQPSPVFIP